MIVTILLAAVVGALSGTFALMLDHGANDSSLLGAHDLADYQYAWRNICVIILVFSIWCIQHNLQKL